MFRSDRHTCNGGSIVARTACPKQKMLLRSMSYPLGSPVTAVLIRKSPLATLWEWCLDTLRLTGHSPGIKVKTETTKWIQNLFPKSKHWLGLYPTIGLEMALWKSIQTISMLPQSCPLLLEHLRSKEFTYVSQVLSPKTFLRRVWTLDFRKGRLSKISSCYQKPYSVGFRLPDRKNLETSSRMWICWRVLVGWYWCWVDQVQGASVFWKQFLEKLTNFQRLPARFLTMVSHKKKWWNGVNLIWFIMVKWMFTPPVWP